MNTLPRVQASAFGLKQRSDNKIIVKFIGNTATPPCAGLGMSSKADRQPSVPSPSESPT
jgi:hypothetical protein